MLNTANCKNLLRYYFFIEILLFFGWEIPKHRIHEELKWKVPSEFNLYTYILKIIRANTQ